jgi:hypothetical protein
VLVYKHQALSSKVSTTKKKERKENVVYICTYIYTYKCTHTKWSTTQP